ncbi:hypothetical protein DV737_g1781, partial [Chaetothyriales sp. CBS 132003]
MQIPKAQHYATSFETSRRDPRLPFYSEIPNTARVFCGRDDILSLIDEKFIITKNLWEHSSRSAHNQAVFWIKADEKDSLPLEYAGIAAELGLVDSVDDQDLQTTVHTFRSWLSHPVRKYSVSDASNTHELVRWLLVFDNVENVDALIDFLPMYGPGSVLMTTRDSLMKPKTLTVAFDLLNLTPLSEKETVDLLQQLAKKNAPQEQQAALSEIATILGGHPLLITSMAGAMRRLKMSYDDFLELYKNSGLKHTSSYDNTYGNTYDIFAKFGFEKLASNALGMLQVLAFLDPDCIEEEILNSDGRGDIHDTDFPLNPAQYFTTRKHLLQSSLIYLNQNTDEGNSYIALHRMVQHITRQKLGKDASEERTTEEVLYIIREAHNNQGSAAAETNDKEECLQHNKEWLKMTLGREDGGIIDYELGIVHNEIGVAYAMNEQYDEAVLNFLSSINIYKRLSDVLKKILNIRAAEFGENDTQSFTHYISRALDIFHSRPYYKNECARSTYKEAEILQAMGLSDLANESFLNAFRTRQAVYPNDDRLMTDLCGEDYDKMVIFWSR